MRLTRRDMLATVFVASAALLYAAWALASDGTVSVRVMTVVVLGLGFAASASAVVPGFDALWHGSRSYLVATSLIGLAALATGVSALVTGHEDLLGILTGTTVLLWIISTARHARVAPSEAIRGGRPTAGHAS